MALAFSFSGRPSCAGHLKGDIHILEHKAHIQTPAVFGWRTSVIQCRRVGPLVMQRVGSSNGHFVSQQVFSFLSVYRSLTSRHNMRRAHHLAACRSEDVPKDSLCYLTGNYHQTCGRISVNHSCHEKTD